MRRTLLLLLLCSWPYYGSAFEGIEGIFCGLENCYDVLEVTRADGDENQRQVIVKAYRKLAKKYHPDRYPDPAEKEEADVMFRRIATAYEILKEEETRIEYNYMLDNPELIYQHYYNYYRRRMSPKVDIRIVILVSLLVISGAQHWYWHHRHEQAIEYLAKEPKYRKMAMQQAIAEKLTSAERGKRQTKQEWREEQEEAIKTVLADNMEIKMLVAWDEKFLFFVGGYGKPDYTDVLILKILLLPYTCYKWVKFQLMWFYRFYLLKADFSEEDKEYLIKYHLGCTQTQWEAMGDDEQDDMFTQQLWIKEKFDEWKAARESENQRKLAESGKYKMYKRYMKANSGQRMTFDPD